MKRQTRSILNELNSMIHERDRQHVFESRGSQIIESAINLIMSFMNTMMKQLPATWNADLSTASEDVMLKNSHAAHKN